MRPRFPFLFLCGCAAAWVFAVRQDPFFWDAVQLGSKHAHHFFQNGLRWTPLPPEIDSGHPPVFGYYLALIWTCFGKTLPASHWAMFPFLCGIAVLTFQLGSRLAGRTWAWGLVAVVFSDPVLAGQSAQAGPDIALVCFFLLALEGLWGQRRSLAVLGILGLCSISMRGMMTAGALWAWQFLVHCPGNRSWQHMVRLSLVFLPGFTFALWFIWWHQRHTGWVGVHPASPWAPAFERATGAEFAKNILVAGWRWLDFGRLVEWGVLVYLLVRNRLKLPGDKCWLHLALLLLCLVLFLTPSALFYRNLSAHRYFLPGFIGLHLLVFFWLFSSPLSGKFKKGLITLTVLLLASGNCWIYPRGISTGWDSTLAHRPYHRLRADMLAFIDAEKLDFQSIGTAFPNINSGENLLLNGDWRIMAEKDFKRNRFILVSNIFNDFSAAEIQMLEREWKRIRYLERSGVWMALYQRKL